MNDINDFVIEDGVLKKYNGSEEIVKIPNSVSSIGKNVFWGCNNLVITTSDGSYAESYAKENGIKVYYEN